MIDLGNEATKQEPKDENMKTEHAVSETPMYPGRIYAVAVMAACLEAGRIEEAAEIHREILRIDGTTQDHEQRTIEGDDERDWAERGAF
ncbi:MAG: hypothetical protein JWM11_5861 [Planctomycetaceae bacterium]|nr:hypothetical protein [Planctomycetaceae bacterium]